VQNLEFNGRFVKLEQWERWRDNRKLVSGSKHRGEGGGALAKNVDIKYAKFNASGKWFAMPA